MRARFSSEGVEGLALYSVKDIPVVGVCGRLSPFVPFVPFVPLTVPLTAPLVGKATIGGSWAAGIVTIV